MEVKEKSSKDDIKLVEYTPSPSKKYSKRGYFQAFRRSVERYEWVEKQTTSGAVKEKPASTKA